VLKCNRAAARNREGCRGQTREAFRGIPPSERNQIPGLLQSIPGDSGLSLFERGRQSAGFRPYHGNLLLPNDRSKILHRVG
jgi:hypothetical protein